ncbi:hypothetical protein ACJX0J_038516 [Zea mays]
MDGAQIQELSMASLVSLFMQQFLIPELLLRYMVLVFSHKYRTYFNIICYWLDYKIIFPFAKLDLFESLSNKLFLRAFHINYNYYKQLNILISTSFITIERAIHDNLN